MLGKTDASSVISSRQQTPCGEALHHRRECLTPACAHAHRWEPPVRVRLALSNRCRACALLPAIPGAVLRSTGQGRFLSVLSVLAT